MDIGQPVISDDRGDIYSVNFKINLSNNPLLIIPILKQISGLIISKIEYDHASGEWKIDGKFWGVCNTMLKYFSSHCLFSNVSFANEATASLHTEVNKEEQKKSDILNEINIEKYKDELMEYQRLQRENLMLKLRLENRTLEKSLGVDSFIPEGVKLVAIMSSGAGSLRAKIYENGLKNVNEGDVLSEKYKVIKINKDNIKIQDLSSMEEDTVFLLSKG